MSRRLYVGVLLALVGAGGGLLWWALSGPSTAPPSRASVPALQDTARIGWTDHHTATIRASTGTDALAALGYVHGMSRAWTLTIWRRTALGTLSATFGDGLVPIDRHARRLGFAHHARRAYQQLRPPIRARLRAYSRGLNAALQSERVRGRTSFVYFDLAPQPWAPWHSLALERLFAWTGTGPFAPAAPADSALTDFGRADRRLRRWLHLHGRTRSLAWAARSQADSTRTALFARHILGSTAEPVIQEVLLRRPNRSPTVAATLPGVPLFPTGAADGRRWTYLLRSPARLDTIRVDTAQVETRYERLAPAQSSERLVEVRRHGTHVEVGTAGPDSAVVLGWPGFRPLTDVPHWLATANLDGSSPAPSSATPDFRLVAGEGLTVDSTGQWSVQGQPPVVEQGPRSILVGHSPWASHQATGLQAHTQTGRLAPAQWSTSDSSAWAGSLLPSLLSDLTPMSTTDSIAVEARSYLRNWNAVYDPASIGAVVFEQWMKAYRKKVGRLPGSPETAYFASPRRRRAFHRAVDTLTRRYGADVRRWRWERVAPDRRYFPVWAADSLLRGDHSGMSSTRFAPLDRPGRGHASSLSGGPALVDPLPLGPAPTRWDGWLTGPQSSMTVRRLRFNPSDFFARSLLPRERPRPVSVRDAPVTRTTRLVPNPP